MCKVKECKQVNEYDEGLCYYHYKMAHLLLQPTTEVDRVETIDGRVIYGDAARAYWRRLPFERNRSLALFE